MLLWYLFNYYSNFNLLNPHIINLLNLNLELTAIMQIDCFIGLLLLLIFVFWRHWAVIVRANVLTTTFMFSEKCRFFCCWTQQQNFFVVEIEQITPYNE